LDGLLSFSFPSLYNFGLLRLPERVHGSHPTDGIVSVFDGGVRHLLAKLCRSMHQIVSYFHKLLLIIIKPPQRLLSRGSLLIDRSRPNTASAPARKITTSANDFLILKTKNNLQHHFGRLLEWSKTTRLFPGSACPPQPSSFNTA
jgi:hypothetical protein